MCNKGESLTIQFNRSMTKTPMPSQKQIMLGCLHDSIKRRVKTSAKKVTKYCRKIEAILSSRSALMKDIESLHGNLSYAAAVAPFARPFLVPLTETIAGRRRTDVVNITEQLKSALRVQKKVLTANRGLSFDFILDKLPRTHDIFTDASTEWGVGGCFGTFYFLFHWSQLRAFNVDFIARKELLAVLIAIDCFQSFIENQYVILQCDNSNVVAQLLKGRSSHPI